MAKLRQPTVPLDPLDRDEPTPLDIVKTSDPTGQLYHAIETAACHLVADILDRQRRYDGQYEPPQAGFLHVFTQLESGDLTISIRTCGTHLDTSIEVIQLPAARPPK